jgi:deazaflavin-dependent oxidoreductase (nitroreductase family)
MLQLTGGRLLNRFRGGRILLLTTTGRRTGTPRTWPLLYLADGDGYVVVGSNGGHDHDPAWCLNLRADPAASVEVEGTRIPVRARFVTGTERTAWWGRFVDAYDGYADYERATDREIPVVVLQRTAA